MDNADNELKLIRNVNVINDDNSTYILNKLKNDKKLSKAMISSVKNKGTNGLIIRCENEQDAKLIDQVIQNDYVNQLEVKLPDKPKAMVKITRLPTNMAEEQIVQTLKGQNFILKNKDVELIRRYEINNNV